MTGSSPGATPLTRTASRVITAAKLSRRKPRDARGEFLAEGPQAVDEAIAHGDTVVAVCVTEAAASRYTRMLAAAAQQHVKLWTVSDEAMAALTETVHPQGIVAVCRQIDGEMP